MVHCCVDGCPETARSPKAICWERFNMCFRHAIKYHPDVYVYNLKEDRKTARRRNLRGGHSSRMENDKPNEEFMLAGINVKIS